MRAGMILSNEPGYYKAGAYGICIENLLLVVERDLPARRRCSRSRRWDAGADRARPDRRRPAERRGARVARRHHARVADTLGPVLPAEDRAWLLEKCAPIGG